MRNRAKIAIALIGLFVVSVAIWMGLSSLFFKKPEPTVQMAVQDNPMERNYYTPSNQQDSISHYNTQKAVDTLKELQGQININGDHISTYMYAGRDIFNEVQTQPIPIHFVPDLIYEHIDEPENREIIQTAFDYHNALKNARVSPDFNDYTYPLLKIGYDFGLGFNYPVYKTNQDRYIESDIERHTLNLIHYSDDLESDLTLIYDVLAPTIGEEAVQAFEETITETIENKEKAESTQEGI